MNKVCWLLVATLFMVSCKVGTSKPGSHVEAGAELEKKLAALKDTANFTSMEWLDSTFIDMGNVVKGQDLDVVFRFKNTGNKPLVISQVTAGCGCTIPETPQEPFAPGAEGEIKARFSSANQTVGPHRKPVYVTANSKPNSYTVLEFNVNVTEK